MAKTFRCKSLILRAGFLTSQWIQGDKLWKKCLLSRGSNVYFSRLDKRAAYFIRYATSTVCMLAVGGGECQIHRLTDDGCCVQV
jgi:hypothetical protein